MCGGPIATSNIYISNTKGPRTDSCKTPPITIYIKIRFKIHYYIEPFLSRKQKLPRMIILHSETIFKVAKVLWRIFFEGQVFF